MVSNFYTTKRPQGGRGGVETTYPLDHFSVFRHNGEIFSQTEKCGSMKIWLNSIITTTCIEPKRHYASGRKITDDYKPQQ